MKRTCWLGLLDKEGLASKKPIKCKYDKKYNQYVSEQAVFHSYKHSGRNYFYLEARLVGNVINERDEGYILYTSYNKKDIEMWMRGARAAITNMTQRIRFGCY